MDTPGTQTFVKLSSLYFSFGVSFIGGSIVNILVNLLSVRSCPNNNGNECFNSIPETVS